MIVLPTPSLRPSSHELQFRPLSQRGQAYGFPCDAEGHVDMDALSEPQRNHYFYARTVIGREFHSPTVQRRWCD